MKMGVYSAMSTHLQKGNFGVYNSYANCTREDPVRENSMNRPKDYLQRWNSTALPKCNAEVLALRLSLRCLENHASALVVFL